MQTTDLRLKLLLYCHVKDSTILKDPPIFLLRCFLFFPQGQPLSYYESALPVCSVVSNSFDTPLTVACQAPLSMGFSRQEYKSWLSSFSRGSSRPRDEPASSALLSTFLPLSNQGSPKHSWVIQ